MTLQIASSLGKQSRIQLLNMDKHFIGVISDTHGLLRAEAVEALKGSNLIIHAGDVGKPEVLKALKQIAPVVAIRGNIDKGAWCQSMPLTETVEIGKIRFYVLHKLAGLDLDPAAAGFTCVIYGDSHQPSLETRNGVIFLNPGSAGPRRFKLPVSVAMIEVHGNTIKPKLIELTIES
jgi:putative phosphoesterase